MHGVAGGPKRPVGTDLHGRDEAIAVTVDGLDELLSAPAIANRLTHGPHGALEGGLADERLRPDVRAELRLQDGAISMLQQIKQDLKGFRPQPQGQAGTLQPMLQGIEETVAEPVQHRLRSCDSPAPLLAVVFGEAGGAHRETAVKAARPHATASTGEPL